MAQTAETISVQCECGKKLKAPASAVGRKAKCPGCGNVLVITPPPPPEPAEDDGLGALYDLADAEKSAAASNQVDDSPHCPKCAAAMETGAVLCVNCGYDMRTKSKLGAATKAVPGPPVIDPDFEKKHGKKKPVDKMAPEGKFIVGFAASFGLALLGGVVWFLIARFTRTEWAIISMGVGVLAGIGMQIGQKGFSNVGGLAAAGITFLVLVAARFAVILAVVMPSMSDLSSDDGDVEYDEDVVQMMVNQDLRSKNIDPDNATEAQEERAYTAAHAKLKKMSKSEYQALVNKAAEELEKEELIDYVAVDTLRAMKINPDEASETQEALAHKTATQKVNAMNASQRAAELKRLGAKETALAEAEAKKHKDTSSARASGPNGSVVALGVVAIIFLVFGIKGILFLVLALGIAYRTAAGSVSG